MSTSIQYIYAPPNMEGGEGLLAILIPFDYSLPPGVEFITDDKSSLQIGTLHHPKGTVIPPHMHRVVERRVSETQEVLVVKRGYITADIYESDGNKVISLSLVGGDILILLKGGHGLTITENCEIVEVKSGPYAGKMDKLPISPRG